MGNPYRTHVNRRPRLSQDVWGANGPSVLELLFKKKPKNPV